MMLTRKQADAYQYIVGYVKSRGIPPSFDEMMRALGLRSKSGVHRLIDALEARGLIRRIPNLARAIEIVPEDERTDVIGFLDWETRAAIAREANRLRARPQEVIARICRAFIFGDKAADGHIISHYELRRLSPGVHKMLDSLAVHKLEPSNESEEHQS